MLKDLSFAWRTLRAKPLFTIVAVLSLALGIGANTAIFSVVESSILRGLPYQNAEQLVELWGRFEGIDKANLSPPEFLDYQRQTQTLSGLAAFTSQNLALTGRTEAHSLLGAAVTTNFFNVLGARAELGRLISPLIDKPGAGPRVAVVSDSVWRSVFHSDPAIIQHDVTLNGKIFRVIGVLAPKQSYPDKFQVWLSPRMIVPEQNEAEDSKKTLQTYGNHYLATVGRLKPGYSLAQSQAEFKTISAEINRQHRMPPHYGASLVGLQDTMVQTIRPALWVLLTAVMLLLGIACANLAGLLLARNASRAREFAVRTALGATRSELMRLLLSESLLLALSGGALGVVFAAAALKLIAHYSPYDLPPALAPELNLPVLGFCILAILFSAVASGILPAFHACGLDVNTGLKEGSKGTGSSGTRRLRALLVGGEIAVSVMLLIGASLLLHSFSKLISISPGFNPDGVLTARLSLPDTGYGSDAKIAAFWKALLPKLSSLPGARSCGLLTNLPFSNERDSSLLSTEGNPIGPHNPGFQTDEFGVSSQTFRTLQLALLEGRSITKRDDAQSRHVAVVNKHLAEVAFPHQDPIGKRFHGAAISGWVTIIGVVADAKYQNLDQNPELVAYYSYQQLAPNFSGLVLRGNPSIQDLRHAVLSLDPNIPLTRVKPLGDYLSQSLASRKFLLGLLTTFSGLAILLAAIGLYAVLAYSVQQRKQEIGIRIALGATHSGILWMILRESLTIAVIGTAAGLLGATWATSFLKSMLYGVTTTDVTAYVAAVILILTVAIAASLAPAIRATRIDPMTALRYE